MKIPDPPVASHHFSSAHRVELGLPVLTFGARFFIQLID